MEMTDSVHFGHMFAAGGTLKIFSMGKKKEGTWRVERDEICVDRGKDDGGCYQVWMSGKNVESRRGELGATSEGTLRGRFLGIDGGRGMKVRLRIELGANHMIVESRRRDLLEGDSSA
jgi:hypothetical protein